MEERFQVEKQRGSLGGIAGELGGPLLFNVNCYYYYSFPSLLVEVTLRQVGFLGWGGSCWMDSGLYPHKPLRQRRSLISMQQQQKRHHPAVRFVQKFSVWLYRLLLSVLTCALFGGKKNHEERGENINKSQRQKGLEKIIRWVAGSRRLSPKNRDIHGKMAKIPPHN